MNDVPYIINFAKIGHSETGFISVCEKLNMPFHAKRVYWTYAIPSNTDRGGHAHLNLEQILFALSGEIFLTVELISGKVFEFNLNSPDIGVYIPKMSWRTMKYIGNSIQVCIASMEYDENDYIRNYDDFKRKMDRKKV